MRHQHDIDALGIDAGGGEILQGTAGRALGRLQGGYEARFKGGGTNTPPSLLAKRRFATVLPMSPFRGK